MSVTHCALSGQPLVNPVVSIKSGHVFEKSTISKYVEATGRCPITNADLALSDLVPLQVNPSAKPKQLSANSIPGLLQIFQNEWDAVVIETHELKKHLDTMRQELSHALYQHDAACRVIARLLRERDEAREELKKFKESD